MKLVPFCYFVVLELCFLSYAVCFLGMLKTTLHPLLDITVAGNWKTSKKNLFS